MNNFIKDMQKRYSISPLDLADHAETNRLNSIILSFIFFVIGILDLIVLFIIHHNNIREHLVSFIYFGIFTIIGILGFWYSLWVKKVARKNAFFWKTFPAYILVCIGFGVSIYNCYILQQPFNGVLSYLFSGFISLIAFSFSPLYFSIIVIVAVIPFIPGVLNDFGITGLMDTILGTVIICCLSLYKRNLEKKNIIFLKKQKKQLEAKTFGNFTLFYENTVVKFQRTKSNELLAYLIYKNGTSVQTKELLSVLYGDHADSSHYGASLRNLISDVKKTFSELEIQNFFINEYNNFRINPEAINCDYYNFLAGDKSAIKNFSGEFMSQFSWAEETAGFLESRALKK